jgi:para-aminobenzoate synthetase component 1
VGRVVIELDPVPGPLEVCERLAHLPYPILLDSAADDGRTGRYSYAAADPFRVFRARVPDDPLPAARDALRELAAEPDPALPPFQGGLAGFIGYDYGRVLERVPAPRSDDLDVPDVLLGFYDWVVAWDHQAGRAWLVSTGLPMQKADGADRAARRADQVRELLATPAGAGIRVDRQRPPVPGEAVPGGAAPLRSNFTRAGYLAAVARVREYILAGDLFQANISQRFDAPLAGTPFALYRRLRERSPAPYAAWLDAGRFQLLSASPERFLRLDGRMVETRPIKGTRPRSADPARDAELAAELLASGKDRAENVMIVDLLRNDLSRVCRPGSVHATELLALERHPTVHHLVSTVAGELEAGRDAFDLLRAAFPGGSITGAPKVRAMEIIAELEPTRRAAYCGSIGYLSVTGDMDTSIVIRTILTSGGRAYFQAGGGIVADSDPAAEYEETLDKARALIASLAP